MENIFAFIKSRTFKIIMVATFGLALLVGAFGLGAMTGYRTAMFSYAWGENYHRNFGGPRGGLIRDFNGADFIDAHGTFGEVVKLDGPAVIIRGRDGVEKVILTGNDASVRRLGDNVRESEIKIDDKIIVIGDPNNDGQIVAKFIRIVPPPPMPPRR
jgi:hypothetical protein